MEIKKEAYFYEKLNNNKVRCTLCPNYCVLDDGQVGLCRARQNNKGVLYSLNYGRLTALNIDPIEKKPLFHFYPGANIISIGTWGCNLSGQWCQNWEISQVPQKGEYLSVDDLFRLQKDNQDKSIGIAFTYSEPTVFFEYIKDFLGILNDRSIKVILVTNGYINIDPLKEILPKIDAFNIDVKGFNTLKMKRFTNSSIEHIKRIVEFVYGKTHLELTTLIVPTVNDDEEEFERECEWIASISKDIPLHISRYYPNYKFNMPPTSLNTLKKIYDIAKHYLNFVYVGNAPSLNLENTYCPDCGSLMIRRTGYDVELVNYEKGRCTKCGKKIVNDTF